MKYDVLLLVLGMTLVTYIPRALPAVLMDRMKLGPRVEKFLNLIPYTAMAALIFPGIISANENPIIGIAGGLVALVLAWRRCPLMVCVLSAIAVDYVLLLII